MQVICIELIDLYVQMFIPSVNEHCGHYFIVISCLVKPWFISHSFLCDCILICLTSFLHTMIKLCCCVSGVTYLYDSRAYQILELGVSEFCSIVPNHILSLEFVLGFCHGITKGEIVRLNFINHLVGFIPCQICLYFSN